MSIYTPYFYIIFHKPSKRFYAGVRFSNKANPSELLSEKRGYYTSSKIVHELIKEEGLDSFEINRVRVFKTTSEATKYETKFLNKVDAKNNKRFINQHNSSNNFFLTKEMLSQVMIELYGVENVMQHPDFQKKAKETCKEKYGGVAPACSEDVRNKMVQTCMERYGVENALQHPDFQKKAKETCVERYGGVAPACSKDVRNKMSQTCMERYGATTYFGSNEGKEKVNQAMMEKYGVEHYMSHQDFQKKSKETYMERYGVENVMQHPDVQKKSKETCMERYGVENASKHESVRKKVKQTMMERYGVDNPSKMQDVKDDISKKSKQRTKRPEIAIIKQIAKQLNIKLWGSAWMQTNDKRLFSILNLMRILERNNTNDVVVPNYISSVTPLHILNMI